jgi:hypothetical protein
MEKSSKRGKIPPQDWPSIISRYQSGETLASIARTYDCSPPAISYIVSRTRARNAAAAEVQSATPAQEPQLVKSHPAAAPVGGTPSAEASGLDSPSVAAGSSVAAPLAVVASSEERRDAAAQPGELQLFPDETPVPSIVGRTPPSHREDTAAERPVEHLRAIDPSGDGNAVRSFAPAGAPPANAEPRRTLHLSLSGNDGGHRHDSQPHPPQSPAGSSIGERAAPPHAPLPASQTVHHGMGQNSPAGNGAPLRPVQEPRSPKEGAAFIDQALRERVDGDIAAFLAAFDAALDHDTVESRTGLREATDRLLRAGARTRIELERLEARVPLVSREKSGQEARAFRPR